MINKKKKNCSEKLSDVYTPLQFIDISMSTMINILSVNNGRANQYSSGNLLSKHRQKGNCKDIQVTDEKTNKEWLHKAD